MTGTAGGAAGGSAAPEVPVGESVFPGDSDLPGAAAAAPPPGRSIGEINLSTWDNTSQTSAAPATSPQQTPNRNARAAVVWCRSGRRTSIVTS
jgi:hypothetical protein